MGEDGIRELLLHVCNILQQKLLTPPDARTTAVTLCTVGRQNDIYTFLPVQSNINGRFMSNYILHYCESALGAKSVISTPDHSLASIELKYKVII